MKFENQDKKMKNSKIRERVITNMVKRVVLKGKCLVSEFLETKTVLIPTRLEIWLFRCWGCGCGLAVTI